MAAWLETDFSRERSHLAKGETEAQGRKKQSLDLQDLVAKLKLDSNFQTHSPSPLSKYSIFHVCNTSESAAGHSLKIGMPIPEKSLIPFHF